MWLWSYGPLIIPLMSEASSHVPSLTEEGGPPHRSRLLTSLPTTGQMRPPCRWQIPERRVVLECWQAQLIISLRVTVRDASPHPLRK